jgi:hypothetical protein
MAGDHLHDRNGFGLREAAGADRHADPVGDLYVQGARVVAVERVEDQRYRLVVKKRRPAPRGLCGVLMADPVVLR